MCFWDKSVDGDVGRTPQGHRWGSAWARQHDTWIPSHHEAPPLNSKHLTSVYLWTIARAMELTTKGSVMETRQMIEGQMIESGQEPMNVQVVIEEDESGSEFVLLMTCPEFFWARN